MGDVGKCGPFDATLHSSISVRGPPGPSNSRSGTRWPGLNLQCASPRRLHRRHRRAVDQPAQNVQHRLLVWGAFRRRLDGCEHHLFVVQQEQPESRPSRGPRWDASKAPATCGTGWKLGEGCAIAKCSRFALQNWQVVTPTVNGFAGDVTAANAPVVLDNHLTFGGEDKLCLRSTWLSRMAQSGRMRADKKRLGRFIYYGHTRRSEPSFNCFYCCDLNSEAYATPLRTGLSWTFKLNIVEIDERFLCAVHI